MIEQKDHLAEIDNILTEYEKNSSSIFITDEKLYDAIVDKLKIFPPDLLNSFMQKNNEINQIISNLRDTYEKIVEQMYDDYSIEIDVKKSTLFNLAVRIAYDEYRQENKNDNDKNSQITSFEEWNEQLNREQRSKYSKKIEEASNTTPYTPVFDRCNNVSARLYRINDEILPTILRYMNLDEIPLKKHKKDEKKYRNEEISLTNNDADYFDKDVLFLIICIDEFVKLENKKWGVMEKKSSENYARSFLKSDHSLFRTLLRKSMVGKFSKFLYLDFKIRNLFSTLIVLPRSFFLKFFCEDIKADRELSPLANLKLSRQETAIFFKECTLEKQYIESATKLKQYLSSDYGLIDQFYWILQYQRLENFVQGLTDCFKIYDVTCEEFDISQVMDNVVRYTNENSDSTNGVNEKNIKKFVKKITKKYIVYFDNSIKEESLKKAISTQ